MTEIKATCLWCREDDILPVTSGFLVWDEDESVYRWAWTCTRCGLRTESRPLECSLAAWVQARREADINAACEALADKIARTPNLVSAIAGGAA